MQFDRSRLQPDRRQRLAAVQGIQQRLGLHSERCDQQGQARVKFGAEYRPIGFPFFQVPYPHGEMNFNRQRDRVSRQSASSLSTQTGDATASILLGHINSGQISTNNFISSEKMRGRSTPRTTGR